MAYLRPFGYGWTHSFNLFITIEGGAPHNDDWTVRLHEGNGNEYYFSWNNTDSEYSSPKSNHDKLELTVTANDTLWALKKKNGLKYYFEKKSGRNFALCDSIVDMSGNKIEFTYTGGKLTKIKSPTGDEINISYSGNLIDKVYEPPNTSAPYLAYRYQANNGYKDLVRVVKYNAADNDSVVMDRYYYDSDHNMYARIFATGKYSENNSSTWSYKKGDRAYYWYDSKDRMIYTEVINGDGDENLNNDEVIYRAYFKYYWSGGYPDSTIVYYYQDTIHMGAHDPTTYNPSEPNPSTDPVYRKKITFNNQGNFTSSVLIPKNLSSSTIRYENYDSDYNLQRLINPEDDTTLFTYGETYTDPSGTRHFPNETKIEFPNKDTIKSWYSTPSMGNTRYILTDSTRDELWRENDYYYDSNYNLDSIMYASRYVAGIGNTDITTDFSANNSGNLTQIEDPLGNSTYFTYGTNNTGAYLTKRRIDMSPAGSGDEDLVAKYKYNDIGQTDTVIQFRDYPGDSSIVSHTYDILNRIKETHYPDGTKDVFTYDKRGNLIKKEIYDQSTLHYRIKYSYDAIDNLTIVKEFKDLSIMPAPYDSTLYTYNLHGELISFKNANNSASISTEVKYTYDAGRLLYIEYPDNTNDSLGYYSDGQMKFKRDRKGKVKSFHYDKRNRLIKKKYYDSFSDYQSNNPVDSVVFGYDAVGNMISMIDSNDTVNYIYDDMDELDTLDFYQRTKISYEYDKAGNRKRMKVFNSSNPTTVYLDQYYNSYDEANRLGETIVDSDTFEFEYWDVGQLKKVAYPNGVNEEYKLTERNRVDEVKNSIYDEQTIKKLYEYDYKYNEVGDRETLEFYLSIPDDRPKTGIAKYVYDDIRRLTKAQYPRSIYGKTNEYTFDNVGNRLKKIVGRDTTEYTYNKKNNHMTAVDGSSYSYDNNGNLIHIEPSAEVDYYFDRDYENHLTKVKKTGSGTDDSLSMIYCGGVRE